MIHYQLRCGLDHEFDGWFNDSTGFEKQAKSGRIECPECGRTDVERALMAPALMAGALASRGPAAPREMEQPVVPEPPSPPVPPTPGVTAEAVAAVRLPARLRAELQRIRAEVEKNCTYVGADFEAHARAMHRGDMPPRNVYGETSDEQAEALAAEGISVVKIPWIPRADG